MRLFPEIVNDGGVIRQVRHTIHANPELGYEVQETANLVAKNLREWGIEVTLGIGKTGVVGTLRRGSSKRAIGLRADMDALPIKEANTFDHRSLRPGVMHACGHDGHTAMLLGAARYLAKHGRFDGVVHFIFQPAEEGGAGAKAMIDDGLFQRFPVEAVFGVHNWPGMKAGTLGARPGGIMGSSTTFTITVDGTGSHAAMPHRSEDVVLAAANIVVALQSIVSRRLSPLENAVISTTQMSAGHAHNVLPNESVLHGTVRTLDDRVTDVIEARMNEVIQSAAAISGCRATLDFHRLYPATVNDATQAAFACDVAQEVLGPDNVDRNVAPTMASEDFSFMLQEVPGCYAFLGNGDGTSRAAGAGAGPCELHNASYDFNDELLPMGASYFSRLVERFLPTEK